MPNSPRTKTGSRILGIDPGLRLTGYAVIEVAQRPQVLEAGVLRSAEKNGNADMEGRLRVLYDGLMEVIEQYSPGVVALEKLFAHYDHPRTAILMGHARGALMVAAAQKGIPVVSYNATQIKKTITGSGRATKQQMQKTMQQELNLPQIPEPSDVADALAVALCHYYGKRNRDTA